MMSLRNKLYPWGLTTTEQWERHSLHSHGSQYHITHADIQVAPEYLDGLNRLFAPAGVNLNSIATLPQLEAAYSTWYAQASEKERRRLRLKVAKRLIPTVATNSQRMERRVLLSMSRYVHARNVTIALAPEGIIAVGDMCAQMGINPTSITTLAQFSTLGNKFSSHVMARIIGSAQSASGQSNPKSP